MHPKVEAYIQEKEATFKATYEAEKQQFLMDANICDFEFSPDGSYSAEYPHYEFNSETNRHSYCRKVPVKISDEEYNALRAAHNHTENHSSDIPDNSISATLTLTAWIVYIGSAILGFVLGMQEVTHGTYYTYTETVFSFSAASIYWVTGLISGTILLGFAEIIKLLHQINNKLQ